MFVQINKEQCAGAGAATGLLAVCALFAWRGYTGDEFDPGPTATAERERMERIVVATGTIEPEREVEVRPRIAGIVEHILIEAGDEVLEGQLLVEIEAKMLASQVREAEAALQQYRRGLMGLLSRNWR